MCLAGMLIFKIILAKDLLTAAQLIGILRAGKVQFLIGYLLHNLTTVREKVVTCVKNDANFARDQEI